MSSMAPVHLSKKWKIFIIDDQKNSYHRWDCRKVRYVVLKQIKRWFGVFYGHENEIGRYPEKIWEPSSGDTGIKLKTARAIFIWVK